MSQESTLCHIDGTDVAGSLSKLHESLSADAELVLDFTHIDRIDVPAVHSLADLAVAADEAAARVTLRGLRVGVYKVLKLTGLSEHFSYLG